MAVNDNIRAFLTETYLQYGIDTVIELAVEELKISGSNGKDFSTRMNGELCETILELIFADYAKDHPEQCKDWFSVRGLILQDPTGKKRKKFMTELDYTLFTPQCVYLFECKSYSGDKRLMGDGKLMRETGNSCDVYSQSLVHADALDKNIGVFANGKPTYSINMFNFSRGPLSDMRSEMAKKLFPCYNVGNVTSAIRDSQNVVWDIGYLKPLIRKLEANSVNLRSAHLNYVRGLHPKHD